MRPQPYVGAWACSHFLCLVTIDTRSCVARIFFAPPVFDVAVDTHIENREIVWICDLGVYPEVAAAAVLDHLDRYVGDLKGFLAYGGLDRQARADFLKQRTSFAFKPQTLSIVPPLPSRPPLY